MRVRSGLFVLPKATPQSGFYALGICCFGLGIQHAIFEGQGWETIVEAFLILGLSILALYTAYGVPDRDLSAPSRWRALLLSIGITAAFAILAFVVWLTWSIRGPARELSFLVSFAAALGAAVGTQGSLYAVAEKERLKEAQELSKLLMINQRVLRHNIRNELSIALGHLENLEADDSAGEIQEATRTIHRHLSELLEATERTRRIVSIWETDTRRTFDLTEVVETQVEQLREDHPEITFTTELPESCQVTGHPALSLAIQEAVVNAIEHNSADITVSIAIRKQDDGTVIVEVADTGEGISEVDRMAMELPVETPLIHTEGLGLWIMYWTLKMSGGRVEFADNEPQGAVVQLILPQDSHFISMFS
jgi:signal transduction histidine kinase